MSAEWLQRAISIAVVSAASDGGPFGAVIVREGRLVAEGSNTVTAGNDPTAHAEVNAIRTACRSLKSFDLSGCTLYASCEPCPMCLAAIYWARVDRVWFAASRGDAASAGFSDEAIYRAFSADPAAERIPVEQASIEGHLEPFDAWARKPDNIRY